MERWRWQPTSWKVYQVVLFIAVWIGWFLLSRSIDASSREADLGNAYWQLILPALIVWWLLARHGRTMATIFLLMIGIAAFLFVPVLAVVFWNRSELPSFLVILAFPLVILWILLFRKLWRFLMDFAPYGWS
jgi:FlaA1/EpsC-like NDP-sugar epimerase